MTQASATIEYGRRRWNWALLGWSLAASALFAVGCHSVGPSPTSAEWSALVPAAANRNTTQTQSACVKSQVIQASAHEVIEQDKGSLVPAPATTGNASPAVPKPEEDAMIDLAAALRLAGIDSPTINLSREVVNEALARQRAAQVLLLPNFTAGLNYHLHNGPLESSSGIIRVVNAEQSLYAGLGARALAAESVAFPGVRIFSHLGDAVFEPLAARQQVEVRRSDESATENQVLLQVASAYFNLLGAEVKLEALRKGELEIKEIARRTLAFAVRGQGRHGDANRAEARLDLLVRQIQEAEGSIAIASAQLAGLLNLDPAIRLHTTGGTTHTVGQTFLSAEPLDGRKECPPHGDGTIQTLTLIDENEVLQKLLYQALRNRPEIRGRLQAVAEARTRVQQEKTRPFLPTIGVGFSAGTFGGGSNLTAAGITQPGGSVVTTPGFGSFGGRTDFDVFAVWTLQNGGAGNRARSQGAQAIVGQAVAQLEMSKNQVRQEVAEALGDAQAAARQIGMARRQLSIAQDGYHEEFERIKQTVARPLEVIDSFLQLNDARQDLLAAIIAYNSAQYRLFVAIGFSPLLSPEACGEQAAEVRTDVGK